METQTRGGAVVRTQGSVKWFSESRGYGFITPEGAQDEVFVHFSAIQQDGYKTLRTGEHVEFDLVENPKGNTATNVVRS
jgi:CspA family cold shock protein